MQTLNQGMAAVALVTSLGLVAPSTFGGIASAGMENSRDHNPQYVEVTLDCDLDGDGAYETEFELASTFSSTMWQDKNGSTVVVQRLTDLQSSTYEVVNDPTGTAVDFSDPIGYWSPEPDGRSYPQGQHKGQRRVLCEAVGQYEYAPYDFDVEQGEDLVASGVWTDNFVQTEDCDEETDTPEGVTREDLPQCVTYLETDTWLYEVTVSGKPGAAAKSASVDDDAASAERQVKAKKGGKHRGKGKRGR